MCGDFNGGDESGAVRYLENGSIDETFLEDGEQVTSKTKAMPLSKPLVDVTTTVERQPPPPTLVVAELISTMVQQGNGYEKPVLSAAVKQRLTRIYNRFATHTTASDGDGSTRTRKEMNLQNVQEWLIAINGKFGRGSEFRTAASEMGWIEPEKDETVDKRAPITIPPDGILTLEGFLNVYQEELRGGKFWGIAHDLAVLGEALPDEGLFTARFDRMYCSASLQTTAVLDTLCNNRPCPNEVEPSDHLPVAASFELAT